MGQYREEVERLRFAYRPKRADVLLIGESPPAPRDGELRFFYAPELRIDNLYRAVIEAVYRLDRLAIKRASKPEMLLRLQADGIWLIDAVEEPINHRVTSERRRAIRDGLSQLIERCEQAAPARGVVICHSGVYRQAADALRVAGVRVLHDEPLPFPLGRGRREFVDGLRAALEA